MKNNPEQFDKLINNLLNSKHISEHIEQHRHLTKTDMIADTIDVVIEMRDQGLSFSQIAAYYKNHGLNVSPGTVQMAFSVCATETGTHKEKKSKTKQKSKTATSKKIYSNDAVEKSITNNKYDHFKDATLKQAISEVNQAKSADKPTKFDKSTVKNTLHNTGEFRDKEKPLEM